VARRAASNGGTADEIAALLGIARATFYLNLERDPEFQRIIDEARASGCATLRRLQMAARQWGGRHDVDLVGVFAFVARQ
jgi:hypothetical protein